MLVAAAPDASIAFDRSGQRFATAGGPEGGLKLWFTSLWPVNPAALENHACTIAGRNLTHEEWSRFITGYSHSQVCP